VRIPTALCAIHNFIRIHDTDEGSLSGDNGPRISNDGNNDQDNVDHVGVDLEDEADVRRDQIAQEMWDDYQRICAERRSRSDSDETTDDDDDESSDEDDFVL
jgi:hypothetical protein